MPVVVIGEDNHTTCIFQAHERFTPKVFAALAGQRAREGRFEGGFGSTTCSVWCAIARVSRVGWLGLRVHHPVLGVRSRFLVRSKDGGIYISNNQP